MLYVRGHTTVIDVMLHVTGGIFLPYIVTRGSQKMLAMSILGLVMNAVPFSMPGMPSSPKRGPRESHIIVI